ncbi:MAG: ligase-associated DNA damage response endonuclease PdeM [Bacteroidota bacterium]
MNIRFSILDQHLQLLCEKALYWEECNWLVIADVHLGKSSHFRRHGFAVPKAVSEKTLNGLAELISRLNPETVIFLGDLFHSVENTEWQLLSNVIDTFSDTRFVLVEGNHDILNPELYHHSGIEVVDELRQGPFSFTHHPQEEPELYNFCGHIHPAVELTGKGRQRLRFPCFFFGQRQAILPAFGEFTGTYVLRPEKEDKIFVCAKGTVIEVN